MSRRCRGRVVVIFWQCDVDVSGSDCVDIGRGLPRIDTTVD